MADCLQKYRKILIGHGFPAENVSVRMPQRFCPSMAECILKERDSTRYDAVAVAHNSQGAEAE